MAPPEPAPRTSPTSSVPRPSKNQSIIFNLTKGTHYPAVVQRLPAAGCTCCPNTRLESTALSDRPNGSPHHRPTLVHSSYAQLRQAAAPTSPALTCKQGVDCGTHGYVAVTIADGEPPPAASVDAQRATDYVRATHPDEISGLGVRFPRGAPRLDLGGDDVYRDRSPGDAGAAS